MARRESLNRGGWCSSGGSVVVCLPRASEADTTREINWRRGLACAAFIKYVRLFRGDGIRSVTKVLLLKVFVVSVLLYGAQT